MKREGWLMELTEGEESAVADLVAHEQRAHGWPASVEQTMAFLRRVLAVLGHGHLLPPRG